MVAAILFCANTSLLAETRVGLGTSINTIINFEGRYDTSSTGFVHLPIRISNKVMLEPYLIYSSSEA